ncbi:agmatinase family protein [Thermaurantiacus tibetensis]|uniref:agmatinase family protein n=1 Tax=Thermaurantiacus tibetensis TaxID=2759035 RepID=UPI00188E3DF8|nr:agmatinase family protein [Thermaurantiacus tibetensis]
MSTRRLSLLAMALVALAGAGALGADTARPAFPAALQAVIDRLPPAKREFLLSDKAEGIAGSRRKLIERLEGRSLEQVEAYVDGMMAVVEAGKFDPARDLAAIPLAIESEEFNAWKTMRPRTLNRQREPGPIHLSYYMSQFSGGIATFAGAPVAIYPEDLEAGRVDVAIVGAPLDMGSGYRGARYAPAYMRMLGGISRNDMYTMVNPGRELNIVDYGDIAVDNMSTELTMRHVRERVAEIARTGAIPFIVGGDHSIQYANVAGLADVHGKGSFGVVHLDAHYDAGKATLHFMTHGQPVYRAVKEGHVDARHYIQVGLRGGWPGKDGFEWMRDNGMRYHTFAEILKRGWDGTMERALAEAREGGRKIYISFDIDVLDPAYAPGTGTPVPGGLTMREAITIVRRLCAENDLVGFELVEVAPMLDPTYRTALNANFILNACLTGVAMRRAGIREPGYLSELTVEHGQPKAGLAGERAGRRETIDPDYAAPRSPRAP